MPATWHGGFWERLIKTTKRCLKKTMGRYFLSSEEIRTMLNEIESTLNNRSITYVYDGDEGVSFPLTPSCLIYGRRIATASQRLSVKDCKYEAIINTARETSKPSVKELYCTVEE